MKQEKNTRVRIIETTKALLLSGKVDPSMRLIAEESGVTKSALYYFFRDKKDLFAAVMQTVPAEMATIAQEIAEENISPDQKIAKLMSTFLEFFRKEHAVSQLIFRQIFSHDTDLLKSIFSERKRGTDAIGKIINDGMESGVFRKLNPEMVTAILAGILDFLGMALILPCPEGEEKCGHDPEQICAEFLRLLKPS